MERSLNRRGREWFRAEGDITDVERDHGPLPLRLASIGRPCLVHSAQRRVERRIRAAARTPG